MIDDECTSAVVEPPAVSQSSDTTLISLQHRIRQQEILAELGVAALQGGSIDELLTEATRLTARGLTTDFAKVLEYFPAEDRLFVRAGVGWDAGVVGVAYVGADLESPAGFALRTGKPVISNHLENEDRFRTPSLLQAHGIRRAMNVILQGDGRPFGVLEVDSRSDTKFVEHDLAFLQGAANILGMAIERERHEQSLKAAVSRHEVLLHEMNHRVKNSLALVVSMLRLQARDDSDPKVSARLEEASARIIAVARAHDRLYQGDDVEKLDLGIYLEQICKDTNDAAPQLKVQIEAEHGIIVATGRAISSALIVSELLTNAAKYASRDHAECKIWVTVSKLGSADVVLSVRDEGPGLPGGFDPQSAKSLGMRIITAFAQQLNGRLAVNSTGFGTEFVLTIPIGDVTSSK